MSQQVLMPGKCSVEPPFLRPSRCPTLPSPGVDPRPGPGKTIDPCSKKGARLAVGMAGRFTMPGTGFGMCLYRSVREALSALLAAMALSTMPSPARATMPPRSGTAPPAVTRAFSEGLFALPERSEGLATIAARPVWRIPVILVSFSDSSLRYRAADFERQLFDTTGSTATGSVYDYYQWVSRGRLAVHAQVVATVRLRDSLAYYGAHAGGLAFTETPTNSYGMARDALQICQASVDW